MSDSVFKHVGLIKSGQYCNTASMDRSAINEIQRGPIHCGESALFQLQAKVEALKSISVTDFRFTHQDCLAKSDVVKSIDISQFMCTNPGDWK